MSFSLKKPKPHGCLTQENGLVTESKHVLCSQDVQRHWEETEVNISERVFFAS